jgi:hypothetical protein
VQHTPNSAADISLCSLAAAESISATLLLVPPVYATIFDFTDSSKKPLGFIEVVAAASPNYPRCLATYAVFANTSAPWLLRKNLIRTLEILVAFAPSVSGVTFAPPLPANTAAALPFSDPVSVRAASPYTLRLSSVTGATMLVHEMPLAQVYVAEAALITQLAGTTHHVRSMRMAFQPAPLAPSDLAIGSLTLAHALVEGVVSRACAAHPLPQGHVSIGGVLYRHSCLRVASQGVLGNCGAHRRLHCNHRRPQGWLPAAQGGVYGAAPYSHQHHCSGLHRHHGPRLLLVTG